MTVQVDSDVVGTNDQAIPTAVDQVVEHARALDDNLAAAHLSSDRCSANLPRVSCRGQVRVSTQVHCIDTESVGANRETCV